MAPSASAARIYAGLALLTAGQRIDREVLAQIDLLLGLPPDPQATAALVHLLVRAEGVAAQPGEHLPAQDGALSEVSDADEKRAQSDPPEVDADTPPLEQPPDLPPGLDGAFYVYGIVQGEPVQTQEIVGIEGIVLQEVRCGDLAALGHPCPAVPYSSSQDEILIGWVKEHDAALKQAMECYSAVVPCKFNTLIAVGGASADQAVQDWLDADQGELHQRMAAVRGRREYGVRVLWDPDAERDRLKAEQNSTDRSATDDAPAGVRYLYEERQRRVVSELYLDERAALRRQLLSVIEPLAAGIVEESREADDAGDAIVLRCACLVDVRGTAPFLRAMEDMQTDGRIKVQVSGPWPAYNFVAQPAATGGQER